MSDVKLGMLLDETAQRDAIHVAIAPVVAAQLLSPGERVGLIDLSDEGIGIRAGRGVDPVGIVDPFLTATVKPGERFYLFLFPNTVTSLRHEWTHPAFTNDSLLAKSSEQWIRRYAERLDLTYRRLMDGADAWVASTDRWGEYLIEGGKFEGVSTDPEFWTHYEIVRGRVVPEGRKENFFSCSC